MFEPMSIYLSKAQFSLAISKLNSHWQHQNPILIGDIIAQFSLAISKTQFSLALLYQKRSLRLSMLGKEKYHGKILPWQKGPWQSSYKKLIESCLKDYVLEL